MRELIKKLWKSALAVLIAGLLSGNFVYGQARFISGSETTALTSYTPADGKNRIIVVGVGDENNNNIGTVSSITWAGQNLTQAIAQTQGGAGANDARIEIWYLNEAGIQAAATCTGDFVVTWTSGPASQLFSASTIEHVDQSSIIAASSSNTSAAVGSNTITLGTPIAAGVNDIAYYLALSRASTTHTEPGDYTEINDQNSTHTIGDAYKEISTAGNEAPTATFGANGRRSIAGVIFNGVTQPTTYYSIATGNWEDNTTWSFLSNGGPGDEVPVGDYPARTDDVVIRTGHTVSVDAIGDNGGCPISPDGLGRANVGSFTNSGVDAFFQVGDVIVDNGGIYDVTVRNMYDGFTYINGTFNSTEDIINLGNMEATSSATMDTGDDLILSGNSFTILDVSMTADDDLYIDWTDAQLCGTGVLDIGNDPDPNTPLIQYFNGASIAQICSSFTVTCTVDGACGPDETGTGGFISGYTGPGGIGNSSTNQLWLRAQADVYSDIGGTTPANDNDPVRNWGDQSGNNNDFTGSSNLATFRTNIVNSLSVIRFDGSNDRVLITGISTGNSASVTVVTQYTSLPNPNPGLIHAAPSGSAFSTAGNNKSIGMWVSTANNVWGRVVEADNNIVNFPQSTALSSSTWYTINNIMEAGGGTMEQYANNSLAGSNTYDGTLKDWSDFGIGRQGSETWDGDIAEVVVYNAALNDAQRIILNNYLAAKFGFSLSANDLYTMDSPGNGDYDFEVAGIGQAADDSFDKDSQGQGPVRMSLPSDIGTSEFLIWGHDGTGINAVNTTDVDGVIIEARLDRVWRVSHTGDVGTVRITFDVSNLPPTIVGSDIRLLITRDDAVFIDNDVTPQAGSYNIDNQIITFSNVTLQNGNRFTLGTIDATQTPLPIELLYFQADMLENETVELKWATASELNNDFFTIERSHNALVWEEIGTMSGQGTSKVITEYSFIDDGPIAGRSYYRLKQTDYDGTFEYFRIASITNEAVRVYPNPARNTLNIQGISRVDLRNVMLVNSVGQMMMIPKRLEENTVIMDVSNLPTGIYVLQVIENGARNSYRVIKR